MIGGMLGGLISLALEILTILIIVYAVLSWFPNIDRRNPIVMFINKTGDAICKPVRNMIPPRMTGNIDISPIIVILLINVVQRIL